MDELKVTADIEATDQLGLLLKRVQVEALRPGEIRKQAAAIVQKIDYLGCELKVVEVDAHEGPVYVAEEDALYFTTVPRDTGVPSAGHPIVGDPKYFAKENWQLPGGIQNRLHLLARRIVIPHPRGGTIDVTAPLPPHMTQSWNLLGFDLTRYDPIEQAPVEE